MASSGNNWHGLSGTYASTTEAHAQWWVNSSNAVANTTSVHLRLYLYVGGSSGLKWSTTQARSGTFYINGVSRGSGTPPGDAYGGGSTYVYFDTDVTLTHDANGNWSGNYGAAVSYSFANVGSGSGTWGMTLDRLPLAPTNGTPVASLIMPTTARITASVSSWGHGSAHSTPYNIRYRKQGDATWIERGWGASTWDLTGLIPGTTYEFAARARNNQGDTASYTSTQTFSTLPAPNTSTALLKIVGVL